MQRTCNPAILQLAPFQVATAQKHICVDHFLAEDFFDPIRRNKLKREVIPNWNVIHGTDRDVVHAPEVVLEVPPEVVPAEMMEIPEVIAEPPEVIPEPAEVAQPIAQQPPATPERQAQPQDKKRLSDKALLAESGLEMHELTPKKKVMLTKHRKYHQRLLRLGRKLRAMKGDVQKMKFSMDNDPLWHQVGDALSPGLRILVDAERRNKKKKKKGRRYSEDAKAFCIGVYKPGPRVYRFLGKFIDLPSESTVKGWLKLIPLEVGVSQRLLDHLRPIVAKWNHLDRKCVVMFDEVALKKHLTYWKKKSFIDGYVDLGTLGRKRVVASHALVFMVQGLTKRWKQPVAFYFVNQTCKTDQMVVLIKTVMAALQDVQLCVEASVSDQGSTFFAAINRLRQTAGEAGIDENVYEVNGALIQHMFDMSHVIKGIRNNFLTSDIVTPHGTAKLDDIKSVVNLDRDMNRILYKITDKHLNPKFRHKMRVSLAVQVLSRSMSACIGTMRTCSEGRLLAGTEGTEKVVGIIDKRFDLCNGPSSPHDVRPWRTNASDSTKHVERWIELRRELEQWTLKRKYGTNAGQCFKPPSLLSWISNCRGFVRLYTKLRKEGLKVLNLRVLGSDPIENLFGVCRQACGSNHNPTTVQFAAAVRTAMVNNLTGRGRGHYCEEDSAKLLCNLREFLSQASRPTLPVATPAHPDLPAPGVAVGTGSSFLTAPNLREQKALRLASAYITGALLRRILTRKGAAVGCPCCKANLTSPEDELSSDHLLILGKEYVENRQALVYPSPHALRFFLNARTNFLKMWSLYDYRRDVKARVIQHIDLVDDFAWLTCHDHKDDVQKALVELTADYYLKTMVKRLNSIHGMRLSDPDRGYEDEDE